MSNKIVGLVLQWIVVPVISFVCRHGCCGGQVVKVAKGTGVMCEMNFSLCACLEQGLYKSPAPFSWNLFSQNIVSFLSLSHFKIFSMSAPNNILRVKWWEAMLAPLSHCGSNQQGRQMSCCAFSRIQDQKMSGCTVLQRRLIAWARYQQTLSVQRSMASHSWWTRVPVVCGCGHLKGMCLWLSDPPVGSSSQDVTLLPLKSCVLILPHCHTHHFVAVQSNPM